MLVWGGIGLLTIGTGFLVYKYVNGIFKQTTPKSVPTARKIKSDDRIVEGRYLFSGNTAWSRVDSSDGKTSKNDTNVPFSQLDTIDQGQYDAWVVNLQCPITTFRVGSWGNSRNCPADYLQSASKYFDVYNLATKHTDDQRSVVGLQQTRDNLTEAKAQFFGSYDLAEQSDICEIVALPIRLVDRDGVAESVSLPVAFCGWQATSKTLTGDQLAIMDKYAAIMPVFAFVESGPEFATKPSEAQITLARQVVDRGSEFVIMSGPQWIQPAEAYKGKLIMYSLGNFIFDHRDNETSRGASLDVSMTVKRDKNIDQWLEIAPLCQQFRDNCIDEVAKRALTKPKITLSFGIVGSQNVQPKVSPEVLKKLEEEAKKKQAGAQPSAAATDPIPQANNGASSQPVSQSSRQEPGLTPAQLVEKNLPARATSLADAATLKVILDRLSWALVCQQVSCQAAGI